MGGREGGKERGQQARNSTHTTKPSSYYSVVSLIIHHTASTLVCTCTCSYLSHLGKLGFFLWKMAALFLIFLVYTEQVCTWKNQQCNMHVHVYMQCTYSVCSYLYTWLYIHLFVFKARACTYGYHCSRCVHLGIRKYAHA